MDDGVDTCCWNKKGEDPMGTSPFYFSINLFLHQLAIATFLDLCIAQAARLVDFILRIAALEEEDLTIALEGKNVGTDSVEGSYSEYEINKARRLGDTEIKKGRYRKLMEE